MISPDAEYRGWLQHQVREMLDKIGKLPDGALDEAIHDAYSEAATETNNSGLPAQVEYLLRHSWKANDILFHARRRHGLVEVTAAEVEACRNGFPGMPGKELFLRRFRFSEGQFMVLVENAGDGVVAVLCDDDDEEIGRTEPRSELLGTYCVEDFTLEVVLQPPVAPATPPPPVGRGKAASESVTRFYDALRSLQREGIIRISANCLADRMWPDARRSNAHGQVFNLAAGVAGRMLRSYRACHEVESRVWELVPEFIPATGTGDKRSPQ